MSIEILVKLATEIIFEVIRRELNHTDILGLALEVWVCWNSLAPLDNVFYVSLNPAFPLAQIWTFRGFKKRLHKTETS